MATGYRTGAVWGRESESEGEETDEWGKEAEKEEETILGKGTREME